MIRRAAKILGWVLAGMALLAGGIWVLSMALEDGPPKYEGKTVPEWAAQLHDANPAAAEQARAAVTNRIIAAVCERMFHDTNDSALKLRLVESLNTLPGVLIMAVEAPVRRYEAARSLGDFGADARSALPDLIRCAQGPDTFVRAGAIEALGKVRTDPPAVLPVLIASLDDPEEDIQIHAVEALGEYGPLAKLALPKLMPFLTAHSKELPPAARKTILSIDPQALSTNQLR